MKILCRADASHYLGTGHVMRQLTLARALLDAGSDVAFFCRTHPGHLGEFISQQGFDCHLYPVQSETILGAPADTDARQVAKLATQIGADWVFVDHYGADATWERQQPVPVLAVDDMFDRPHACQILLNQNLGTTKDQYTGLVTPHTLCLMGAEYALLRPEFRDLRGKALTRRAQNTLQHILITMGGSDQPNATGWVLDQLPQHDLPPDLHMTVVMGANAPHLAAIQSKVETLPWPTTVLAGTSDMAGLMVQADIAIGAAGSTSWERCALGLPTVQVVLAENQRHIGDALQDAGAAFSLDLGAEDAFQSALRRLLHQPDTRRNMSQAAAEIVDGAGVHRVIDVLIKRE